MQTNLNKTEFDFDEGTYPQHLAGVAHRLGPVTVGGTTLIFADHDTHLCREIRRWPAVVGCMAWLTNRDVLAALQGRSASIIVQKEDWLRPDTGGYTQADLRELYSCVSPRGMTRELAGNHLNYNGLMEDLEGVMCAGLCSPDKVTPRMHHKFMVFGDFTEHAYKPANAQHLRRQVSATGYYDERTRYLKFAPRAVWTGSFNATHNGTMSIENAVLIRDEEAAAAYCAEYRAVLAMAEHLDWKHTWVKPAFRIGT